MVINLQLETDKNNARGERVEPRGPGAHGAGQWEFSYAILARSGGVIAVTRVYLLETDGLVSRPFHNTIGGTYTR